MYFITTASQDRAPLFGKVADGVFTASSHGQIVLDCWNSLPEHYPRVVLDAWQLMPDHFHGILLLTDPKLLGSTDERMPGLSEIMRGFKTLSAKRINQARNTPGAPVWQRGFHDRIVRSEAELDKFRAYIQTNPLRTVL